MGARPAGAPAARHAAAGANRDRLAIDPVHLRCVPARPDRRPGTPASSCRPLHDEHRVADRSFAIPLATRARRRSLALKSARSRVEGRTEGSQGARRRWGTSLRIAVPSSPTSAGRLTAPPTQFAFGRTSLSHRRDHRLRQVRCHDGRFSAQQTDSSFVRARRAWAHAVPESRVENTHATCPLRLRVHHLAEGS